MNNQQKKYYEYLSCSDDINKEQLELFSIYIAQNPAFKYNTTYLLDSIDDFKEKINIFKKKELLLQEWSKELRNFVDEGWMLIIDNFFVIDERKLHFLPDIAEKYSGLDKYLNKFNLFTLSSKNLNLRLLFKLSKTDNNADIFGKEYTRTIKHDDKAIKEIKKYLETFIKNVNNTETFDEQ